MSVTFGGTTIPFARTSREGKDGKYKINTYLGVDGGTVLLLSAGPEQIRVKGFTTDVTAAPTEVTLRAMELTDAELIISGTSMGTCFCSKVSFDEYATSATTGARVCDFSMNFYKLG